MLIPVGILPLAAPRASRLPIPIPAPGVPTVSDRGRGGGGAEHRGRRVGGLPLPEHAGGGPAADAVAGAAGRAVRQPLGTPSPGGWGPLQPAAFCQPRTPLFHHPHSCVQRRPKGGRTVT